MSGTGTRGQKCFLTNSLMHFLWYRPRAISANKIEAEIVVPAIIEAKLVVVTTKQEN